MSALHTIRPATLGREIERRYAAEDVACKAIFDAALHGQERLSEIKERLGVDDPRVVAYRLALDHSREAEREAERRYGRDAVPFRSMWPTFLATVRVR